MLKNNKLLYYVGVIFIIIGLLQYCVKQKAEVVEQPSKTVEIDLTDISKTVSNIKDAIETTKNAQEFDLKRTFATYTKDEEFDDNRVALCFNSYDMNFKVFSSEGEKIYENDKFTLNDVKESKVFYNFLEQVLLLTRNGEVIDIFVPNLSVLPQSLNVAEGSMGLVKISNLKITGDEVFFAKGIDLKNSIYIEGSRKRESSKYSCKDAVKINFTIYNASEEILEEGLIEFVVGNSQNTKERLFQYLVLTSPDGSIDAELPAYRFNPSIKDQKITIKGEISYK
jgi:hypothetical protein